MFPLSYYYLIPLALLSSPLVSASESDQTQALQSCTQKCSRDMGMGMPPSSSSSSNDDNSQGVVIVIPDRQSDTGMKPVPDDAHPFMAPGAKDQRGPCPGLNTLANHGYLPRNGIVTLEEIINATGEGFNMDRDLAAAIGSFAMLARGNSFIDKLSLGGPVDDIPALPGNIDGSVVKGLATHGRFEGDVSMTRQDAAIGDNVHFDANLFDILVENVGQFGDDSPVTGNKSVVTPLVMNQFKFSRFVTDQAANPQLDYTQPRFSLSYGESAFALEMFANGTDHVLSVPTIASFFRNQTFPKNWFRRSSPATIEVIDNTTTAIFGNTTIVPGKNDDSGKYIPSPPPGNCSLYTTIIQDNLPSSLANTTGVLKQNVDVMLDAIFNVFKIDPTCQKVQPNGAVGV